MIKHGRDIAAAESENSVATQLSQLLVEYMPPNANILSQTLTRAIKNKDYDIVDTLLSAAKFKGKFKQHHLDNQFKQAAVKGCWDIVKLFCKHNVCNVLKRFVNNQTVFSYAAEQGNCEMVLFIYNHLIQLKNKNKINDQTINKYINYKSMAYTLACIHGDKKTIDALVKVCKVHVKPVKSNN